MRYEVVERTEAEFIQRVARKNTNEDTNKIKGMLLGGQTIFLNGHMSQNVAPVPNLRGWALRQGRQLRARTLKEGNRRGTYVWLEPKDE